MCILFIAIQQHPEYPLIIAANRDEFHQRPTRESHFWSAHPTLLAGQDLEAGGTWMGVTTTGKLAALTNVRDPRKNFANAISRGKLTTDFLTQQHTATDYLQQLKQSRQDFNGYNLLFGDWRDLWVYNNHLDQSSRLGNGFYGLSNAHLNSPWPKINQGVAKLKAHCQQDKIEPEILFDILYDQTQADDQFLPDTGVPIEWERKLSSIFIQSPEYGTRSATLLLINRNNQLVWHEHSLDRQGTIVSEQHYQFLLT